MKTPAVLVLAHRRPGLVRQCLEKIRAVRPGVLYFAVDGPQGDADRPAVEDVRSLAVDVGWPCEVFTLFQEKNLGCQGGVRTALDWFFERENEGIVLEEDCMAGVEFFEYCTRGLEKFRSDHKVGWISGFLPSYLPGGRTSRFALWGQPWGWATWADRWKEHRKAPASDAPWEDPGFASFLGGGAGTTVWKMREVAVQQGYVNSWFFPWQLDQIIRRRYVVLPPVNLVNNQGFGVDATHTPFLGQRVEACSFAMEWKWPEKAVPDPEETRRLILAGLGEIQPEVQALESFVPKFSGLGARIRRVETFSNQVVQAPIRNLFTEVVRKIFRKLGSAGESALQRMNTSGHDSLLEKIREEAARIGHELEASNVHFDYGSGGKYHHAAISFGQEGEDLVLKRIFNDKKQGLFVDVGAHHPFRFSNTYAFYSRGWQGITIEPTPGSGLLFSLWRPRDLHLEMAASNKDGILTFHVFEESAYNTCDQALAEKRLRDGVGKGHRIVEVPARPLTSILDQYLPGNLPIDLMSIDTEGHDLEVLQGLDFQKYAPHVLLCESLGLKDLTKAGEMEVVKFLKNAGYRFFSATYNTLFFIHDSVE